MSNKKYSIRKTLTGVGSVAIATLFLGVSNVHADEVIGTSSEPTTTVTTSESQPTAVSESQPTAVSESQPTAVSESQPTASADATSDNTSSSSSDSNVNPDTVKPTETTGVLRVQDIDIINQKAINDKATVVDLKDSESTTVSVPTDKDSYLAKGYAYDYTINVATGEQFNTDKDVTVSRNQTTTLARIYRYVGVNTGDKDTLVKTDNSLKKDVYFVGALDKDGKTALERFAVAGGGQGDPYLETGSMYEINGIQVWCSAPTMPATAGQKYVAKVVDESTKNALINAFGIGYGDNSKDNYLLVDIEQGMMWEAQGYTHIFDKVQINPDNSGGLRDLTTEEQEMVSKFKEAISKASEIYQSEKKANLTYNGTSVSDTDDAVTELTFEEGKVPDSIALTGDAQMLHYYKNGAIKTPDGTVLTIDDVKGLATLSKLSGLTQGDYVLRMSMIRDNVQGDTTEWTAEGQQTMRDYRIKNVKWETVKIKVTPKKIIGIPNEAPEVEKPEGKYSEVPNTAPEVEKPTIDVVEKVPNEAPEVEKPEGKYSEVPNTAPEVEKPTIDVVEKVPNEAPEVEKPEGKYNEVPNTAPEVEKPTIDVVEKVPNEAPEVEKPEGKYSEVPNTAPEWEKPTIDVVEKVPNEAPEWEKPTIDVPIPEKPVTPTPNKPVTPTPVSHKETPKAPLMSRVADRHELPNTGSDNGLALGIFGSMLTVLGLAGTVKKRKDSL